MSDTFNRFSRLFLLVDSSRPGPGRKSKSTPAMPVKLSQAAFCSLILDSSLLSQERLARLREEFLRQQKGRDAENCLALTEFLVRKNELTLWQAKKLLQGKHKGFFIGKYKLLSLLGRGGMSSVYLAEHTMMRRRCAIKILPFKQVKNAAALSRFHREAQAVASLDDHNIVRAYDVDKLIEAGNEIHYLVMEYVDGRSLQQLVDEDGPLPVAEAVEAVRQAASGLAHAHSVGVVHRDVKPSNLLLDETGTVKLLDLGLARIFEDASEQSSLTIEHQQTVLGTADYLSPEQAVDSHGVDHRSDIYSLGCTLYFLLTGQPPFPEGTLTQRLLAHQTKTPAPVTSLRSDVPKTLVTILDRMMAKRPALRFQSAAALVDALTDWLGSNVGEASVNRGKEKRSQERARPQTTSSARKKNVGQSRDTPRASDSTSTKRSPAGSQPSKKGSATSTTGDSVRDGDSDENLLSFLRDLNSTIGHETVDPSFPTSDTIVTSAKDKESGAADVPAASSSNVLDLQLPDSNPTEVATAEPDDPSQEIIPSSVGQPRRKRSRSSSTIAAVLAGGLIAAVLAGSFVFWNSERQSSRPASKPGERTVTESVESPAERRIEIAAGEDLRVGPDGHFPTIGEALAHVRETFHPLSPNDSATIRVAGGQTYNERIAIDNSLSRTFPQGVRLICEDDEPAILAPVGSDPILDLRTVERFHIKGFTLRGTGQPELVRLEGYLVRTVLENLVLEGAAETALRGLGATGFAGANRLILRNLTLRDPSAAAVGMRFASGSTPTKNLLIDGCRVVGNFETGIRFRGGVSGVEVAKCIFDGTATSLEFDSSPDPREDVLVTACTFRDFDWAIRVERPLTPSDGTYQFTRNLFADASGPECVIGDGASTDDVPPPQLTASYNWTQRPEPASPADGEIDIFANHGRRGADITFMSVDPTQPATYLKPENSALHAASQQIPSPPRQIGAVIPAEH